jgi:hypothetical protein
VSKTERESEERNKKKNRACGAPQSLFLHDKNKKIGTPTPLSHSFCHQENCATCSRFLEHIPNTTPSVFVEIPLTFQPTRHRLVQNV